MKEVCRRNVCTHVVPWTDVCRYVNIIKIFSPQSWRFLLKSLLIMQKTYHNMVFKDKITESSDNNIDPVSGRPTPRPPYIPTTARPPYRPPTTGRPPYRPPTTTTTRRTTTTKKPKPGEPPFLFF
jgi:hypothetical protein